jgi:hypothetical protein
MTIANARSWEFRRDDLPEAATRCKLSGKARGVVLAEMSTGDTHDEPAPKVILLHGDPVAIELTSVIHRGDVDRLRRLLAERPEFASVRMIGRKGLQGSWRTPLHAAADWPATSRMHLPRWSCCSTPARIETTTPAARTQRRRCTGRPAPTTKTSRWR